MKAKHTKLYKIRYWDTGNTVDCYVAAQSYEVALAAFKKATNLDDIRRVELMEGGVIVAEYVPAERHYSNAHS